MFDTLHLSPPDMRTLIQILLFFSSKSFSIFFGAWIAVNIPAAQAQITMRSYIF